MAYLRPSASGEGILCMDHAGFAAMSAACPEALPLALRECTRLGIDPVAASSFLRGVKTDSVGAALQELLSGTSEMRQPALNALATPVPLWPYPEAGERLAAGLVLGICPILLQRLPDIALEKWINGLDTGPGTVPLRDKLSASIDMVNPV